MKKLLSLFVVLMLASQMKLRAQEFMIFSDSLHTGSIDVSQNAWSSFSQNPAQSGLNPSSTTISVTPTSAWQSVRGSCNITITEERNVLRFQLYSTVSTPSYQIQLLVGGEQLYFNGTYNSGHWGDVVLDLSAYENEELTWYWVAPTADQVHQSFIDNIYMTRKSDTHIFIDISAGISTLSLNSSSWSNVAVNPDQNELNSSNYVISNNSTSSWQGFSGNCVIPIDEDSRILHLSFLSPSGSGSYQVQLYFQGDAGNTVFDGYYTSSNWESQILDISQHTGKVLNWFNIYPSASSAVQTYVDNIYLDGIISEPIDSSIIAYNHSFDSLQLGIPLLTNDQGRLGFTEMMSEYALRTNPGNLLGKVDLSIDRSGSNPILRWGVNSVQSQELEIFDDETGDGVNLDFTNNPWSSVVANPLVESTNTSEYVIKNDPSSSWQGLSGTASTLITDSSSMYIMLYHPEGPGNYQIQLHLDGQNEVFNGSYSGYEWEEIQIDLSTHAGKGLSWFWIAPTASDVSTCYFDDVFITKDDEDLKATKIVFSTFSSLHRNERLPIPNELKNLSGISFRARSLADSVQLVVKAKNDSGSLLHKETLWIDSDWNTYSIPFCGADLRKIIFKIRLKKQPLDSNGYFDNSLYLDDLYLLNNTQASFKPSDNDAEFLSWLKNSSLRYFLWNYVQLDESTGVVQELSSRQDHAQISGQGMALASFVLAEQEGLINQADAKQRIQSILTWIYELEVENGTSGVLGFPQHWMHYDGTPVFQNISTIDWAMCAAGVRVAKQYYNSDSTIVSMADSILNRARWDLILNSNDRIPKAIDSLGNPIDGEWGDGFSEEAELIYLEAVASGKLDSSVFNNMTRTEKHGFYPSWFGSGFTYNWLQLWTGLQEPLSSNSEVAYYYDAKTSSETIGLPLIGLTAAGTLTTIDQKGFAYFDTYISNQGSEAHGSSNASEIVSISPAPYGAALAYSFTPDDAMTALREYTKTGFYHPFLGLPDNIRMKELPSGANDKWIPNWERFDINQAAIAMALEQSDNNSIGNLYLSDTSILNALNHLLVSIDSSIFSSSSRLSSMDEEALEQGLSHLEKFNIFPNPTYGKFAVTVPNSSSNENVIRVYDLRGNIVQEIVTGAFGGKIDITDQLKGVYVVQLSIERKTIRQLLIKK